MDIGGKNQAGVSHDGRLIAGLLFTVAYTLAVFTLQAELASHPGIPIAILAVGGGALWLFFSWKPALVVSLVLFATTNGSCPWKGVLAGGTEELLKLIVYIGVALGTVTAIFAIRKAAGRTEERYRVVAESASDGIVITDEGGNYLWANLVACEIFGYSRLEMLDLNFSQLVAKEDLGALPVRAASRDGRRVLRECRARRKDGARLVVEVSGRTLTDGRFMAIVRDVSARKAAEEEINASLKEKEVLLREVHHRVKNNLQIVSSLIHLQSRYVEDPRAQEKFTESLERIKSIALLHEKLYLSKNLAKIDFAEYVPNLVSSLAAAYRADPETVRMEAEVQDVSLELETAVPCGLIITELVSNALKYAFPGGRRGSIRIELSRAAGQTISLRVADNGVGLPETPEFSHPESLGLTLVATLVRQLKGKLEIGRDGGTQFTITFALQKPIRPSAGGGERAIGAQLSDKDYDHVFSAHSSRRG